MLFIPSSSGGWKERQGEEHDSGAFPPKIPAAGSWVGELSGKCKPGALNAGWSCRPVCIDAVDRCCCQLSQTATYRRNTHTLTHTHVHTHTVKPKFWNWGLTVPTELPNPPPPPPASLACVFYGCFFIILFYLSRFHGFQKSLPIKDDFASGSQLLPIVRWKCMCVCV